MEGPFSATKDNEVQGDAGSLATQLQIELMLMERVILDAAPDGILLVDRGGHILMANPAMERLCGYTAHEMLGASMSMFLPPPLREMHGQQINSYFAHPKPRRMGRGLDSGTSLNLSLRHKDGSDVPVGVALGHVVLNGVPSAIAFVRDLTEHRLLETRINHQARHDALTGLANRWQFDQILRFSLAQAARFERRMAILLLDLDEFKTINDGYGHSVGDQVLFKVSNRLSQAVRSCDTLARLGGDEFVVLLPEINGAADALAVAEKLREALTPVMHLEGCDIYPSASIGVACFPEDARDHENLLRYADMAMYRAKGLGRNRCVLYDEALGQKMRERLRIQERLQSAFRHGELRLHYQPQIEVGSGHMTGVEALLRWTDAELGSISPEVFIPIAESTGLIHEIGDWVLEESCRQWHAWAAEGMYLNIAINLSARQFHRVDLAERLLGILRTMDMPPQWLELEITESEAMLNPEETCAILRQLVLLGVKVTLDDFGKGHSSLSYLQRMPVTQIKIDRDFIARIPGDESNCALTRAILALAHTLGLEVVAEGVEMAEQLTFLHRNQCPSYQGWLFAPAVTPDKIPALWARSRALATVSAGPPAAA